MILYLLVQDQVSVVQPLSYIVCSGTGPVHVLASHDHPGASSRQVQGSFLADAGVASSDDDRLNMEIEFNRFLKYIQGFSSGPRPGFGVLLSAQFSLG